HGRRHLGCPRDSILRRVDSRNSIVPSQVLQIAGYMRRCSCGLSEGLVVCVAMFRTAVERGAIRSGQWLIFLDPLDQIWVCNEESPKDDCVCVLLLDSQSPAVRGISCRGE